MIVNLMTMSGNMFRRRFKWFVYALMVVCVFNISGIGDNMFAKKFDEGFDYPLNIDLRPVIFDILEGTTPGYKAINYYPYKFVINSFKCKVAQDINLVILVKSSMHHFVQRAAIRKTYGKERSKSDTVVKTVFLLGVNSAYPNSKTQKMIDSENDEHGDIVQIDFEDSYYNNTIKTIMAFRWAFEQCYSADLYLFTDDDMYISVPNLLEYARGQIPAKSVEGARVIPSFKKKSQKVRKDAHFYAGYVFNSSPHRYITSKWRVSLEEYPWDKWPPYVTAGAYVVSNLSMRYIYLGSNFVKHFRFDDIYLGIVALRAGINLTHCPRFHYYKKTYSKEGYRDVIASHGYSDYTELIKVWKEQNNRSRS